MNQIANENLCDIFNFYLRNLVQFLNYIDNEHFDSLVVSLLGKDLDLNNTFYNFEFILASVDIEYLHKILTKESFFAKILHHLTSIVELIKIKGNKKSESLKELLSKTTQNLTQNYFLKIQSQLHTSQQSALIKFLDESSSVLANYYDFSNKNQYLSELLDQLLFTQSSNNSNQNENSFILSIRLKFAYKVLSNQHLLQICEKKFQNLEYKLFNMAVSYYLLYDENSQKKVNNLDDIDFDQDIDDFKLIELYLKSLFEKYNLFKQLDIKLQPSIELMLNDLIFKYSFRFKLIEVSIATVKL